MIGLRYIWILEIFGMILSDNKQYIYIFYYIWLLSVYSTTWSEVTFSQSLKWVTTKIHVSTMTNEVFDELN